MKKIRVASGQGFWGDLLSAPVDQVRNGQIDFLMLDYLAEVTMSIMQKQRARDPSQGYARDFVPLMAEILPDCADKGIRVVANAGGVNPTACAERVLEEARNAGLAGRISVGVITGDDILERLPDLIARGHALVNMDDDRPLSEVLDRVQSANAYIGAKPIVDALDRGATVVITGRSTDTALTYAPMIHAFGWAADDWDRIAAGVVAGHINECGAHCTGGNSLVGWPDVPSLETVGFPIIEAAEDGTFAVRKSFKAWMPELKLAAPTLASVSFCDVCPDNRFWIASKTATIVSTGRSLNMFAEALFSAAIVVNGTSIGIFSPAVATCTPSRAT
jgi:hypothetical protein